ncbi:restriction endonuclease subunit S [Streptococcus suis]|nr:restriction endonuclease subunit S [Streptococcus suis]
MSEKFIIANNYCREVFDGTHDTPKPSDHGYKLVTSKNIIGNTLDLNSAYLISQEDYLAINKRSKVSQFDVLFSMIGSVGNVYIEQRKNEEIDYSIKNIGVFSSKTEKEAYWLYYYLQSPYAQSFIKKFLNGAVQKFLPLQTLRAFPILSPVENYESIISILKNIDQKIALNNQINGELEAMAKTLYDYWFVQFDFPDENGKPYKSSGGKMVYNDQLKREIPEGWGVEAISNILDKVPNSNKIVREEYLDFGTIPVIDQSREFICGYTENQNSILTPNDGHIVFGDHTRIVKYINFEYARGADGTQIIISKNENVPTVLLYQFISSIDLSNYGYARHYKFLKEKLILVPNINISRKYSENAETIFNRIRQTIFENQELTQLRDWLLPMLMNGQVKVEE